MTDPYTEGFLQALQLTAPLLQQAEAQTRAAEARAHIAERTVAITIKTIRRHHMKDAP